MPGGMHSIRGKLNRIVAVTTIVALALAALALLMLDLQRGLSDARQDIVTQADVLALTSASALSFADRKVATENLAVLAAKRSVVAAALYDDAGRLFASYRRDDAQGVALPDKPAPEAVHMDAVHATAWRTVRSSREQVGMVWLQVKHGRLQQALESLLMLALVMAGSLAAAQLLSNRLQATITGPILDISDVARKILAGQGGTVRARRRSDDEVGELVDAFNGMLDELEQRARTLEAANLALKDSEARYQLAVRGSSAGLWDWNIPARSMFFSPRFRAVLGYSDEEFADSPGSVLNVLHPEDRGVLLARLKAHLREQAPFSLECRLRDRAGQWRWFLVAGAALWDAAGQPFRMAGSAVEVTERKEAERVLQDASRAKDEFLATLAHELRNPLAPLRTGLDILRKDTSNGPASAHARQTMERQLMHMIRLIDDLLDISRINVGIIRLELERTGMRQVVASALDISMPAINAAAHTLTVDMPDADIELMGDPTRLSQALGNLLNNAAKYTPPGGRITVRVQREGTEAVIEVADSGEGIPADMLQGIFSLFTQVRSTLKRSQGGLGIGLYLVRNLIALHGGSVVAHSEGAGQGSVFTVRLPCLDANAVPEPAAPAQAPGRPARQLKVMVVDDNVDAADMLATVLQMSGCSTAVLYEGSGVLSEALVFGPDVVLLDIGLPGMSGYDVARQLAKEPRLARTLLVAVTGWGADSDRARAREAGFHHHLTKPIDFADLEPLLRDATAGREPNALTATASMPAGAAAETAVLGTVRSA